ncbi:hypothetical protein [Myxosarcina sp. GI1(2024)]
MSDKLNRQLFKKMLPQFYLDYLKTYLPDSELLTLQILVWLLQVHRQVRIERLASSFPYPINGT